MANKVTQMAFLRNGTLFKSKIDAKSGLKEAVKNNCQDGSMVLARYYDSIDDEVKSLIGIVYSNNGLKTITIFESDEVIVAGMETENVDNNTNESDNLHYGKIKTKPNQ